MHLLTNNWTIDFGLNKLKIQGYNDLIISMSDFFLVNRCNFGYFILFAILSGIHDGILKTSLCDLKKS